MAFLEIQLKETTHTLVPIEAAISINNNCAWYGQIF
jgi:hypothetical protein